MAAKPLTDSESEALRLRAGHPSIRAAAKAAGMDESVLRRQLNRAEAKGYAEPGAKFALPANQVIKGVSSLVDSEGVVKAQWIRTKTSAADSESIIATIKGAFEGWEARAEPTSYAPHCDSDLATLLLLPDAHLGQLSWGVECGADYDLRIAEETITDAFRRLVDASPPSKLAVVLGLGDLLHADGYENFTAKSKNVLDVDSRWPRVLKTATRLIIASVQVALTKHERVLLRILPGNHDNESSIAIALACSLFFSSDPRVTVDDDPSYFWWWEWGQTLIGATHGDQTRMKDVPLTMAARRPEAWGRCRYKHAFTGHVHHASAIEAGGVIVESLQSPAASDAWHSRQGFASGRSLTSVTYHLEHGEISRNKSRIVA